MKLIIFTILIFVLTVLGVCLITPGTKVKDAVPLALKKWSELIQKVMEWDTAPTPDYPVYLGYDGVRIQYPLVDAELKDLCSCFPVCYCNGYQIGTNTIVYRFAVKLSDHAKENPADFAELIQRQAEAGLMKHLQQYHSYLPAEQLLVVQLRQNHLLLTVAKNERGIQELEQIRQQQQTQAYAKVLQQQSRPPIQETWRDPIEGGSLMNWGYQADFYQQTGKPFPIQLKLSSYPHALLTGSSGSGKSTALLFLLGKLVQAEPDITIYFCDFKNSEDFDFMKAYPHYYAGDACRQGILDYYAAFSQARQERTKTSRHVLICDEYPALISYLQARDKREKTKAANDVLAAIAEILMLGRGTGGGFGCWVVTQRADASLFSSGSRDNFMITIALGRLSKEQKGMLFPGEELPDRMMQVGEGLLLADGMEMKEVKYPVIADLADWEKRILDALLQATPLAAG